MGRVEGMYPPAACRDAFVVCLLIVVGCLVLCVILRKQLRKQDYSGFQQFFSLEKVCYSNPNQVFLIT